MSTFTYTCAAYISQNVVKGKRYLSEFLDAALQYYTILQFLTFEGVHAFTFV